MLSQRTGNLNGAMPVGIRLDDGSDKTAWTEDCTEPGKIMDKRGEVDVGVSRVQGSGAGYVEQGNDQERRSYFKNFLFLFLDRIIYFLYILIGQFLDLGLGFSQFVFG